MDKLFMDAAFKEAKKAYNMNEVPIGAVIVKDNHIIAKSHNLKEHDNCCISHAEILAIKKASAAIDNWRLCGCDIYITLDPCPMCASAIKQARINNVYSANNNSDTNNVNIINSIFKSDNTNPQVNFISNLDKEKSQELLNNFFNKQRN